MSAKKKTKTPSPAKRGGSKPEPAAHGPSARALHSVDDEAPAAEPQRGHARKRKGSKVPPPPELETVFTPVEIDFFERAADMYADEYDVWSDFRPKEVN